jgi:hypothetical protein
MKNKLENKRNSVFVGRTKIESVFCVVCGLVLERWVGLGEIGNF